MRIPRRLFVRGVLCALAARVAGAGPVSFATSLSSHYDVMVIGAGLAGLYTAMLLEDVGLRVIVLEGRQRAGGRVKTLMNVPGRPEAGGEIIGGNYARMMYVATSTSPASIRPCWNVAWKPPWNQANARPLRC